MVPFSAVLPAGPASLPLMRNALRAWLEAARWPFGETTDLILGVNEAVTNAVEHAYQPGQAATVQVTATEVPLPDHKRRAEITILDRGRWRPAPADTGRGIAIMHAVAASLDIDPSPDGAKVTMTSQPVA